MRSNRVFLPQEALHGWLDEERITLDGEIMTLKPEGQRFRLSTAVRFIADLTESGDQQQVLGKVKDLEQLTAMSGEHSMDSVIFGDDAYQVIEGFVGDPIFDDASATGADLAAATRAAIGGGGESSDTNALDPLTRFFLKST
jgi:hypothetical protein